ncbi:MAG: IPT/TIG domain-containing protein [Treponema sp.]|nr:IPT/TIG domain-containing protein [Treponema sp.]
MNSCENNEPEIISIEPHIGRMGDTLTITGTGFGDERNESFITIAGTPPTSSSYLYWSNEEIRVRIPDFGEAGLVYIHRGRKKSNPALFANQATLPMPVEGSEQNIIPRISSLEPESGAIGSIVSIKGNNFGSSRESGGVFFSWDSESSQAAPAGIKPPDYIEAFEMEFGYELWSEREIRVRIPDGAISGNLEVRTSKGNSRPVFFEVTGKPGTKVFKDKRSYIISYMVDVKVEQAVIPNSLYIWMPKPAISSSQRNVSFLSRNAEPFVENHQGSSLYQFNDLLPRTAKGINISCVAEVYTVETNIRTQTPVRLNEPSPVGTVYTLPSSLIPSDDAAVKAKAAEIAGRERYPYGKAQKIYEWLISSGGIKRTALNGGVLNALEEKQADSYSAALLFCALLRAENIPAIPLAGVLVNRQRGTSKHYWAEFWLDGFGWVPADPTLGAGVVPPDFNLREDYESYYFGNVDNQRLTFSRGEHFLSRMAPGGRIAQRSRDYSLQNIWEEAAGGLESYSSLWSDITITGMYVE